MYIRGDKLRIFLLCQIDPAPTATILISVNRKGPSQNSKLGKMNKNYAVINNQDSSEIEDKIKEI